MAHGDGEGTRGLDEAVPPMRVPWAGLTTRLFASPGFHRLVPEDLAFATSAVRARRHIRRGVPEYAQAEERMRRLLEHTPRAPEAAALAERWMIEKSIRAELFWRPWRVSAPDADRQRMRATLRTGRGTVAAFVHLDAWWAALEVIRPERVRPYIVVAPHFFEPPVAHLLGYKLERTRRELQSLGTLVRSRGTFAQLARLLRAGAAVATAFDVPGSSEVPFLGHRVGLAEGPARLSYETGALFLPFVARRRGGRIMVGFADSLDPRDYPDAGALRAAAAEVFEGYVLEAPEAVERLEWLLPGESPAPLHETVPEVGQHLLTQGR